MVKFMGKTISYIIGVLVIISLIYMIPESYTKPVEPRYKRGDILYSKLSNSPPMHVMFAYCNVSYCMYDVYYFDNNGVNRKARIKEDMIRNED